MYKLKKPHRKGTIFLACFFILLGLFFFAAMANDFYHYYSINKLLPTRSVLEIIVDRLGIYAIELVLGIVMMLKAFTFLQIYFDEKKLYKWLSKYGTLIKNNFYSVHEINGIKYIVVMFYLPNNSIKIMRKEWHEVNYRERNEDGIDVVYDPSDPNKCVFQFNVEEINDKKEIDKRKEDKNDKIVDL